VLRANKTLVAIEVWNSHVRDVVAARRAFGLAWKESGRAGPPYQHFYLRPYLELEWPTGEEAK